MENNLGQMPSEAIEQSRNMQELPPASGAGMDASELVESLLSNEQIPKHIANKWWVLFSKSLKLTFLDDKDIEYFNLQFELLKLTHIESIPKAAYNEELEDFFIQAKMEFDFNIRRAKGSKNGLNERGYLGSSTTATFSDRQLGRPAEDPGFLSRIANILR